MSRRLIVVLSGLLACALAVTAVAFAHGGSGDPGSRAKERGTAHAKRLPRERGMERALGQGIIGMVVDSLAGRLSVQPADLRKAVAEVAKEQKQAFLSAAGITQAEQDNLKACHRGRHARQKSPPACDAAAAKATMQKLRAAAAKPDLAKLKTDVAASLATKLGKTPDEVLTAVRAELAQRLDQAVGMGFVTAKGRDLALACFDTPASCDLKALQAEVKLPFGHGAGRGMGHRFP
jgi:hypothetical protein